MLDTGVSQSTYSARRTNGVVFHAHDLVHPRLHRYNTLTHTPALSANMNRPAYFVVQPLRNAHVSTVHAPTHT